MPVRQRRRRRRLAITAILVAVGAAIVGSHPGQAAAARLQINDGLSSCPAGYVCLWVLDNFRGGGYAFYNSENDYFDLPAPFNGIYQNSWSFYNHGNTHDIRFFRWANYSGDNFVLCRNDYIPELPHNSDVDPPASEPGEGWRDQITGHRFESGVC